jgi:probable rRNA maturation factor
MGPPSRRNYVVLNRQRRYPIHTGSVHSFLAGLIPALGIGGESFSIVFTTDKVMRRYNAAYRGLDKSTDVLSFRGEDGYLGDILISSETAYRQARNSRTLSFESNIQRLVLHGLLHLMGYDHESDQGQMRAIERRFRRKLQC